LEASRNVKDRSGAKAAKDIKELSLNESEVMRHASVNTGS
jgi:hypothetical protein